MQIILECHWFFLRNLSFNEQKGLKLDIGVAPETKIKSKGDDSSNERVVFVSKYFSPIDIVEKSAPDKKESHQNHSSPLPNQNSEIDSKSSPAPNSEIDSKSIPTQNSKVASSKSFLRQISRIYSKPEPNEISEIDEEISSDDETSVKSKLKKDFKKRSKFFLSEGSY